MAALTRNRTTPTAAGTDTGAREGFTVGAGVKIYQGAFVALNAQGYVVPATSALNLTALGRAEREYPLSTVDGEFIVQTRNGVFGYENSGDITEAHKGSICWLVDDQTVSLSDGGLIRSPAGAVSDVSAGLVWVELTYPNAALKYVSAGGTVNVQDDGVTTAPAVGTLDFVGPGVAAGPGGAGVGAVSIPGAPDNIVNATAASVPATAGDMVLIDSTANAVDVTLPAGPAAGDLIAVKWTAGALAATLTPGAGDTIDGAAGPYAFSTLQDSLMLVAKDASTWEVQGEKVAAPAATLGKFDLAFTNATLAAGVLTVTHNLGRQYVNVSIYDDSDVLIVPDSVTATSSTVATVDLSTYGVIAGTWNAVVVG